MYLVRADEWLCVNAIDRTQKIFHQHVTSIQHNNTCECIQVL